MIKCPKCGTQYNRDVNFCKICGNAMGSSLKTEETTAEDPIIAEEEIKDPEQLKKEQEEERLKAEQLQKEQEEQRLKAEQRRKEQTQKLLKIIKKGSIVTGAFIVLTFSVLFIWHAFDDSNIEKAETAVASGDYNKAISYYKRVMPLSYAHKETTLEIEKLEKAGALYEQAKKDLADYKYHDAMQKTTDALALCPKFKVCDELFTEAQTGMGRYIKKQFDAGKYKDAYRYVSAIYEPYRNEEMNSVADSIKGMTKANIQSGYEKLREKKPTEAINCANMVYDIVPDSEDAYKLKRAVLNYYITTGTSQFKNFNMDSAISNANAALELEPDNEWAKKIKDNVSVYNTYEAKLNKAGGCYRRGEYTEAKSNINSVPDDAIGTMAKRHFSTLINTINADSNYLSKPVIIDYKNAHSVRNFIYSDAEVYYTLKNRISRPVKVTLKANLDKNNYNKTVTVIVDGNSTYTGTVYFNGVLLGDTYWYGVEIKSFDIQ